MDRKRARARRRKAARGGMRAKYNELAFIIQSPRRSSVLISRDDVWGGARRRGIKEIGRNHFKMGKWMDIVHPSIQPASNRK
jgi:hypothetical protein